MNHKKHIENQMHSCRDNWRKLKFYIWLNKVLRPVRVPCCSAYMICMFQIYEGMMPYPLLASSWQTRNTEWGTIMIVQWIKLVVHIQQNIIKKNSTSGVYKGMYTSSGFLAGQNPQLGIACWRLPLMAAMSCVCILLYNTSAVLYLSIQTTIIC